MEYGELLKAKRFSLNSYPKGKFWKNDCNWHDI